ncbi:MAG: PIG-L family deacetylase, partial [Firmicutes bacterium]|nr:PIG-L family deacetylase [Bacillota bacterium]
MIRKLLCAVLAALCCLAAGLALAEEAENITGQCKFRINSTKFKYTQMTDGKYTTYMETHKVKNPSVTVSAPAGKRIYGVYVCFGVRPEGLEFQVERGGEWVCCAEADSTYYHVYCPVPEGVDRIRLVATGSQKQSFRINEIFILGQGEVPAWVQRWEPTPEKADMMLLVAHPDDDLIFFGGTIPTYAGERGCSLLVAYMTHNNPTRISELLNALWALGVRQYPVIGNFSDSYQTSLERQYERMGGEAKVLDWAVELYRRYKPEVVLTQDVNGEYGHPQHKMVADASLESFDLAADASQYPDSAHAYGTWLVKKLYLHLYGEEADQTVLDWEQPLSAFGGKTGAELAAEAFALHVSQKGMGAGKGDKFEEFKVETTGAKKYPYDHFGLAKTTVGPDEAKNDFLEHIDTAEAPVNPDNSEGNAESPEEQETEEAAWQAEEAEEAEEAETDESAVPDETEVTEETDET